MQSAKLREGIKMISHPINPVYNENSKILILGSFPSVKSREEGFFYGHKQNRFWKVLSTLLSCKEPLIIKEKKKMLLSNGIALWDVIQSCEIEGSKDSSIINAVPNDISRLLKEAPIKKICLNGKLAYNLYCKYIEPQTKIKGIYLPSTSPANGKYAQLDKLIEEWKVITE